MNILVTGANGQLGNEMRILASKCISDAPGRSEADRFIFSDVVEAEGVDTTILDITDTEAVRQLVRKYSVGCIVNCAAYTNVEKSESNESLAEMLNAEAPKILAGAMKDVGGLLIHISTDYVFGAEPYNTPCREDQKGTPTGAYGRTKLHGEANIMNSGADYVIIRTAWLYSEFGKNFLKTMLALTQTKPQLKVVFDQTGTPTYALDLAGAIMTVLSDYEAEILRGRLAASVPDHGYSKKGIYHFSNEGVCSWYDFTKMIAEYSGHTSCEVLPCHSNEFPSPVVRPAYSVLDKSRIKETFGIKIPYWTDSLKKCISNLLL